MRYLYYNIFGTGKRFQDFFWRLRGGNRKLDQTFPICSFLKVLLYKNIEEKMLLCFGNIISLPCIDLKVLYSSFYSKEQMRMENCNYSKNHIIIIISLNSSCEYLRLQWADLSSNTSPGFNCVHLNIFAYSQHTSSFSFLINYLQRNYALSVQKCIVLTYLQKLWVIVITF